MDEALKGYCIVYTDVHGVKDCTFFGAPITNITDMTDTELMRLVFFQAHPSCSLLDMFPCTFGEFKSRK